MANDEHMLYTWFLISFKPKKKLEKKKFHYNNRKYTIYVAENKRQYIKLNRKYTPIDNLDEQKEIKMGKMKPYKNKKDGKNYDIFKSTKNGRLFIKKEVVDSKSVNMKFVKKYIKQ